MKQEAHADKFLGILRDLIQVVAAEVAQTVKVETASVQPEYMNATQTALYMGISIRSFDAWIAEAGIIPYYFKPLKNPRYKRSDIDATIEKQQPRNYSKLRKTKTQ